MDRDTLALESPLPLWARLSHISRTTRPIPCGRGLEGAGDGARQRAGGLIIVGVVVVSAI
jgi:hypothetical protein